MSERKSLRLSEFFNDDDSEGHRFAEFITKRRGGVIERRLFIDCETESLSSDIHLERLPSPQLRKICETSATQLIKENNEPKPSESPDLDKPLDLPVSELRNSQERKSKSPTLKPISNISAIRKSDVDFFPSVRLRRLSMKNYSIKKIAGGRRTMLQEFNVTNFDPSLCSTPILQPKHNLDSLRNYRLSAKNVNTTQRNTNNSLSLNSNQSPETENIEANSSNITFTSGSCCGHTNTLIANLQRKDAKLKTYMDIMLNKPLQQIENQSIVVSETSACKTIVNKTKDCSTLNHRFTVENSSTPGQIILNPEKPDAHNTRKSNSQCLTSLKNPERKSLPTIHQHSRQICNKTDCQDNSCMHSSLLHGVSKTLQVSQTSKQGQQETSLQIIQTLNPEVPHSSQNCNISNMKEKSKTFYSGVEQTSFNKTISKISSKDSVNKTINDKSKHIVDIPATPSKCFQLAEDNLKLTEILTDDEEEAEKTITLQASQNTSAMPLNLAASANHFQKKNVKRRSQKQSTEARPDIPSVAHSNRFIPTKKCKPLNKAPGIPINGEKYAKDLEKMSNYEIIDLRKRNSMGNIFVISGRKSNQATAEVNKKQMQLADQIEKELLKRKLEDMSENAFNQLLDQSNIEEIPVPNDFRDSLAAENLLNELPSECVKFKDSEEKRSKSKKKIRPNVLLHYLEISSKCSIKKQRKSKRIKSKRSLFNQKAFHSFGNSSPDKTSSEQMSLCSSQEKLSMPYLQSPPETNDALKATPKIVSPPLPICISSDEMPNTLHNIQMNENDNSTLPPPPPGFESDLGIDSNNYNNQYSTNNTIEADEMTSREIVVNSNIDDLFKKPTKRAPKRKGKKEHVSSLNTLSESAEHNQESVNGSADLTEGVSLRRSKRGLVPIRPAPIIEILHQQEIKIQENYKRTSKLNKMKVLKSLQNQSSKKIRSRKNKLSAEPKENNNALSICTNESSKGKRKAKRSSKIRSAEPQNVNQNLQEIVTPNESSICGHLSYNATPSLQPAAPSTHSSVSSTREFIKENLNKDFISWLKNMSEDYDTDQPMTDDNNGMQNSAINNLFFTECHGVEYAFYETEDKASLGYLRFQPRQVKPMKRAKRFHLHFVNIVGEFRITKKNGEHNLGVGELVVIEKFTDYSIQNLTDDIGVLMVIKK